MNSNLPLLSATPPHAGQLLIADPSLQGSQFQQSVVLITEYSPETGAKGIILNHPTDKTLGDIVQNNALESLSHIPVHQGGPVAPDQLTFSSLWWDESQGLKWNTQISAENSIAHLYQAGHVVRAFIGYSAWSPGQLENELQQQSWFAIYPHPGLLDASHHRDLWATLLSSISPFHRILAQAPADPFLN